MFGVAVFAAGAAGRTNMIVKEGNTFLGRAAVGFTIVVVVRGKVRKRNILVVQGCLSVEGVRSVVVVRVVQCGIVVVIIVVVHTPNDSGKERLTWRLDWRTKSTSLR